MRTWEELWIKYWGRIDIDDIARWDVIELDYPTGNRRFIVDKVEKDYFHIDNRVAISKTNPNIIWVIRGFPNDDEMRILVNERLFYIDVPDKERSISPYFSNEMIERFRPDIPYKFNIVPAPSHVLEDYWLDSDWWFFEKRWILWDSLKFYAVWEKVSYFI